MKRSLNPTRRPNKWQQAQRYELIVKNGKKSGESRDKAHHYFFVSFLHQRLLSRNKQREFYRS